MTYRTVTMMWKTVVRLMLTAAEIVATVKFQDLQHVLFSS